MNDDDNIQPGCGCRYGLISLLMFAAAFGFLLLLINVGRAVYPTLAPEHRNTFIWAFLAGLLIFGVVSGVSKIYAGHMGSANGKQVVAGLEGDGRSCIKTVIGIVVVLALVAAAVLI
jgi:hypothetical protein